jgi:hypothetical protein
VKLVEGSGQDKGSAGDQYSSSKAFALELILGALEPF